LLTDATHAQDILSIVRNNLDELNDVNVSTAFSRLGRMAKQRDFPGDLTGDEAFRGLLRRARDFALNGKFSARSLANVFHAIAKLSATRLLDVTDGTVEETWAALDGAAVRAAPDMKPQELANTLWAYATLGGNRTETPLRCLTYIMLHLYCVVAWHIWESVGR
jgi:hypothetical protein